MTKRENYILKQIIRVLKKYLNPSQIILFGSRTKETNSQHADFDIAVDLKKPSVAVQRKVTENIEEISGLYKVDIVYMLSVDKEFKKIIETTGRIVYERRA